LVSEFRNYVLLYLITPDTIDIVRVIRGGQEIDQLAFDDA